MCVCVYICVCVCVIFNPSLFYDEYYNSPVRRKVPKSVCVSVGGGGGAYRYVIYVPSTNINDLYLDIWLFTNSHLCQFIEIVHKIINWYNKNAK